MAAIDYTLLPLELLDVLNVVDMDMINDAKKNIPAWWNIF